MRTNFRNNQQNKVGTTMKKSVAVQVSLLPAVAAGLAACSNNPSHAAYQCVGPNNQVVPASACSTHGHGYFWFYPSMGYYHPLTMGSYVVVDRGYREPAIRGRTSPSRNFATSAKSLSSQRASAQRANTRAAQRAVSSRPSGSVSRGTSGRIGSGRSGFSAGS